MKIVIRFIFLFLFALPVLSGAQSASKKHRQLLLNISKAETTDGYYILTHVGKFKFQKYISGKDTTKILRNYGTVIHESCHHLNNLIGRKLDNPDFVNYEGYFIAKGVEFSLLFNDVYNSIELNKFVQDSLQEKIFRYNTYVGDPKKILWMGSQINGVYGMLEEYCAYYQGSKAQLELYDFYYKYRCNGYENIDEWYNYLQNFAASYYAYYEFNLFVSWYLQYAKLHHPKTYTQLMNDTEIRVVYTLLTNQFSELIEDYYTIQKNLIQEFNSPERKVSITKSDGKTWFTVETEGSLSRSSIQDYEAHYLEKLLESDEHKILEEFKIDGATIENYKSFLK